MSSNPLQQIQQQKQNPYLWCSYQAVDNSSIIVQLIFLSLVPIFMTAIIYYIRKLYILRKKSEQLQQLFSGVYIFVFTLLFIWSLFALIKISINVIIYYTFIQNSDQYPPTYTLRVSSGVFQMFDTLSSVCLILILIKIPCQWISFVIECANINDKNNANMDLKARKYISYFHWGLKWMNRYIVFRMFSGIYFIIEAIMIAKNDFGIKMPKYNSYYMIGEATVLLFVYIFGSWEIRYLHKSGAIPCISNSVINVVNRQYCFLIAIQIARIIHHLAWRINPIFEYNPNQHCQDENAKKNRDWRIILLCVIFIVQFFSAAFIIVIYRPKQQIKNQSLLATEIIKEEMQ